MSTHTYKPPEPAEAGREVGDQERVEKTGEPVTEPKAVELTGIENVVPETLVARYDPLAAAQLPVNPVM